MLANIINALKNGSSDKNVLYISLKAGSSIKKDMHNRTFYLWNPETIKEIFTKLGLNIIDESKSPSVKNSKDLWLGYVLSLVR